MDELEGLEEAMYLRDLKDREVDWTFWLAWALIPGSMALAGLMTVGFVVWHLVAAIA